MNMKNLISILFLFILIACSSENNEAEQKEESSGTNTTSEIPNSEIFQIEPKKGEPLTYKKTQDSLVVKLQELYGKDYSIFFDEISKWEFDSLKSSATQDTIPTSAIDIYDYSEDTCIIMNYESSVDSFCYFDDGEYFEKYHLKGEWTKANQVLINFQNWEEQHDFLVDKKSGKMYILNPEYSLSPNGKFLVTYANTIDYPIYPNNILLAEITPDSIKTQLNRDLSDLITISYIGWLGDFDALVKASEIDLDNYEAKNPSYFKMKINNSLQQ